MRGRNGEADGWRLAFWLWGLGLLLVFLFCVSMCVGRYAITPRDVAGFFLGEEIPDTARRVILYLRIPRTLLAVLIGAALPVSGAIYQSAFHNRLVSPDLLGVSSGASVGACFAILLGLPGMLVSALSFAAGLVTVALTVLAARLLGSRGNVVLLLSGIAIGGLMSSLVGLLKYLADDEMKLAEMTYWILGDISGADMSDVRLMCVVAGAGCTAAVVLSWKLNIISLGPREAKSLGVNYRVTMGLLIVIATVLTAGAVSVSGTIGWVGLVIPNIVRLLVGSDNRRVIPVSVFSGACMMVLVDMLARSLSPNEIPLSVVTGIIGTPLFLWSVFRSRREY